MSVISERSVVFLSVYYFKLHLHNVILSLFSKFRYNFSKTARMQQKICFLAIRRSSLRLEMLTNGIHIFKHYMQQKVIRILSLLKRRFKFSCIPAFPSCRFHTFPYFFNTFAEVAPSRCNLSVISERSVVFLSVHYFKLHLHNVILSLFSKFRFNFSKTARMQQKICFLAIRRSSLRLEMLTNGIHIYNH